jgi:hypothetical protein
MLDIACKLLFARVLSFKLRLEEEFSTTQFSTHQLFDEREVEVYWLVLATCQTRFSISDITCTSASDPHDE